MYRIFKTIGDWKSEKNIPVVKEKCLNPKCSDNKKTQWISPATFVLPGKCAYCSEPLIGLDLIKELGRRKAYHLNSKG
jgi:hypothetical protein